MPHALPWRAEHPQGDAVQLHVTQALTAGELTSALTCSKAMARRILAQGRLARAGRPLQAGDALAAGELVCLALDVPAEVPMGSSGELRVVYQDRLLLAADKPAGLLVHADGSAADTLTARVQGMLAQQGQACVAQAVQRLDVETTGLVLFSLAQEFQPALDAQVAGHDMRKRYLAVVEGRMEPTRGWQELTWPIARDRHDARRMRAGRTGKPALTRVRVLAARGGRSLVLAELETGRRHQIRVHLARAGHPIVGDVLYGARAHADGLMLHAWTEQLVHPLTGELVRLEAPVPGRFAQLFDGAPWEPYADGRDG